ncbi:MAG: CoA-binding protein [Chloroflexi bacterium]|nr:CoA-binding protein [Chloroflexota bacterium]
MTWDNAFDVAFHPETIAIVGVSNNTQSNHVGFTGLTTLRNIRKLGFEGRLYPINPRISEVDGVRVYPNVSAVPEPVDLVIVAVPAEVVPRVLEDCVTAKALNIHIMTSGFGETGQADGKRLNERIREIAQRGNLRIIGPNCMGIQSPGAKMATFEFDSMQSGPVSFVSQSGSHVMTLVRYGPSFGIGFSKAISSGNSLVLDTPDFLEYLGNDPETGIITLYVEGGGDGRRLMQLTREINPVKPVIIWKAGLTESGAQAALSHTGSLKGDRKLWDAFFRQTGAIQVNSLEELADITMTLLYLKPLERSAAAVLCGGGGSTVASGDICGVEGIETPLFSEQTKSKLLQFVSLVNQGIANPMDIPHVQRNPELLSQTLDIVAGDPAIDLVIVVQNWESLLDTDGNRRLTESICRFARENKCGKPVVVAVRPMMPVLELPTTTAPLATKLIQAGIPVYASLARACRAIRRFTRYHQHLRSL